MHACGVQGWRHVTVTNGSVAAHKGGKLFVHQVMLPPADRANQDKRRVSREVYSLGVVQEEMLEGSGILYVQRNEFIWEYSAKTEGDMNHTKK